MKGYQFHLEYESPAKKRKNEDMGNVCAVDVADDGFFSGKSFCRSAVSAIFNYANSPVAATSVSVDWLRTHTKRINEQKAREIHPELFAYLDQQEQSL